MLAVWITEDTAAPHEAAIDHLNRTSTGTVGYALLQVRFAPSPTGHYVHFEKVAMPNAFIAEGHRASGVNPERRDFMSAVYAILDPALLTAGYRKTSSSQAGSVVRAFMPVVLPLSAWCRVVGLRMSEDDATVTLVFRRRHADMAAAKEVLALARERCGEAFASVVGAVDWDVDLPNQSRGAFAQVRLLGGGYGAGEASETADWALKVMVAWLDAVRANPISESDIEARVGFAMDVEPDAESVG